MDHGGDEWIDDVEMTPWDGCLLGGIERRSSVLMKLSFAMIRHS